MTPAAIADQVTRMRERLVGFKVGTVEVLGLDGYEESLPEGEQLRLTLTLAPPDSSRETWAVDDANRLFEAVDSAAAAADVTERFTVTFTNEEAQSDNDADV